MHGRYRLSTTADTARNQQRLCRWRCLQQQTLVPICLRDESSLLTCRPKLFGRCLPRLSWLYDIVVLYRCCTLFHCYLTVQNNRKRLVSVQDCLDVMGMG